jgi:hypothetical protein
MSSKIEIVTDKDKTVNTAPIPSLKVNMDNIELDVENRNRKNERSRIEIPERISVREDSDSASEDKQDSSFKFLLNPSKINPVDSETKPADDQLHNRVRSDSESGKSETDRYSSSSEHHNDVFNDYKPRYDSSFSSLWSQKQQTKPDHLTSPPVESIPNPLPSQPTQSFLGNDFPTHKTQEFLSEDEVRRMKSQYLDQYEKKNKDYKYSHKRLTMKHDLEDIKSELAYITEKRRNENHLNAWKSGLIMFARGIVIVNDYAHDPFDLDLSDWSKDLYWSVWREGQYDEIMEELVEKYHKKGSQIAPEWRLLFMVGMSMGMGIMQKKQEKSVMQKRIEDEKRIQEQVRNEVREQMAQMRFHSPPQTQTQSTVKPVPMPYDLSNRPSYPSNVQSSSRMTGPSMSESEILKLMETNFMDSTIAGDDSTLSSRASKASSKASNRSQMSTTQSNKANKETTRKKQTKKKKEEAADDKTEQSTQGNLNDGKGEDDGKVVTLPAASTTRGGSVKKPRGRPRKNAKSDANVVTLDRL